MIATPLQAIPSVTVMCYHTFLGKQQIPTDFSLQEFKAQMLSLKNHGIRFVTLPQLLSGEITGNRNVLITIDDGHVSCRSVYTTVLKPLGIKPVFAIYPGIISSRSFALRWEDLKAYEADGASILSHGYFHEYLFEKAWRKNPQKCLDEIVKSKKILEKHLGHPIVGFVYPFGSTSAETQYELQKAGYQYAFTITPGDITHPFKHPYELPRTMITRQTAKKILTRLENPN